MPVKAAKGTLRAIGILLTTAEFIAPIIVIGTLFWMATGICLLAANSSCAELDTTGCGPAGQPHGGIKPSWIPIEYFDLAILVGIAIAAIAFLLFLWGAAVLDAFLRRWKLP